MIEVYATDLKRAVGNAVLGVGKKSSLFILECILLDAKDGAFSVRGTNLEMQIVDKVQCTQGELSTVVQGNIFYKFVSTLQGNVTLESEEDILVVRCGDIRAEFPTYAPEEFVLLPSLEKENEFEIDTQVLVDAILNVSYAASSDESRAVLQGVYFKNEGGKLEAVGVDGFRLAMIVLDSGVENAFSVLLPAKNLAVMAKIANKDTGTVKITLDGYAASFAFSSGQTVYLQSLAGNFVNYMQLIPQDERMSIFVDSKSFTDAVRRAMVVSKEDRCLITISPFDGGINVLSDAGTDLGLIEDKVECDVRQEFKPVSANGNLMLEALSTFDCDVVELNIDPTNNARPIVLRRQEKDLTCLIMPMHLNR